MSAAEQPVRLGVVMLCHSHLGSATTLARIWADGGAQVMVHVDAKADEGEFAQMQAALHGNSSIGFSARRACNWGQFDLVQATLDAATALLETAPEVTHVLLVSGSCLPLRPVKELVAYLQVHPGRDFIESVVVKDVFWAIGGLNEERFTRYFPFDWRNQRRLFDGALAIQRGLHIKRRPPKGIVPHLGSQWWCLTRGTLSAILNDPRRQKYDRYFRLSWIPDESYFQTLARVHSPRIESRSLTLARFDHQGKPYIFYDDHLQMLEDSGCFVARKVWAGAEQLAAHFPRPSPQGHGGREPDPSRIEKMLSQATKLRRQGRPGLYMQSRFPQRSVEHGRTVRPYGVLQGFAEIVPGFQDWLSQRVVADVHGHLFGPERAEFAGGGDHGPGALSSHPTLRDYDAERFLASLLRMTDRTQIFQFGPADTQKLNEFMIADPNARIAVITGAWTVPLYLSQLPFDQIRQRAAQLQKAEVKQFQALNVQWRRAQIRTWDLADFAARPQQIVDLALSWADPQPEANTDLPPLPDLSGIGAFLQDLRNAGLRPELTGHFPPTDPASADRPTA